MTGDIQLRDVVESDLPVHFEYQRDPESNRMAAFPPRDETAFAAHWEKISRDEKVITRTIVYNGHVAGSLVSWDQDGSRMVGYWIGREYWGKGIATRALTEFLRLVKVRPLHAFVAKHNVASLRVLLKCGFRISGEGLIPFGENEEQIQEFSLTLEARAGDAAPGTPSPPDTGRDA